MNHDFLPSKTREQRNRKNGIKNCRRYYDGLGFLFQNFFDDYSLKYEKFLLNLISKIILRILFGVTVFAGIVKLLLLSLSTPEAYSSFVKLQSFRHNFYLYSTDQDCCVCSSRWRGAGRRRRTASCPARLRSCSPSSASYSSSARTTTSSYRTYSG